MSAKMLKQTELLPDTPYERVVLVML